MEFKNSFNISNLFLTKEIFIFIDKRQFKMKVKSVRDFIEDYQWNSISGLWQTDISDLQKMLPDQVLSSLDFIKLAVFKYGYYTEFKEVSHLCQTYMSEILINMEVDFKQHEFVWFDNKGNSLIITPEIWDYVLYILKLSHGEKVNPPIQFENEEARKFYLAQMEYEKQIKRIKQNAKNGDDNGLIKSFLMITYAFPSLTIDYLFNQTMAQIRWLQEHAAGAVSYSFNEKAMAAGNVKKGKKLDFFIK